MKAFWLVLAACLFGSSIAQAVTFQVGYALTIDRNAPGQGLAIGANPGSGQFTLRLNGLGDRQTVDLFDLFVTERTRPSGPEANDRRPRALAVQFDFGAFGAVVQGTRQAARVMFPGRRLPRNAGVVEWADPIVVAFGNNQELTITLSDEAFSGRARGLARGPGRGLNTGPVQATFELTAVPVPAALPLLASGLGLLAWLGRRRRVTTAPLPPARG